MNYLNHTHSTTETKWYQVLLTVFIVICFVLLFSLPHQIAIVFAKGDHLSQPELLSDFSYLMSLFDSNTSLIYVLLPFVGGFIALFLMATKYNRFSIVNLTTTRNKIDWKRFFFMFLLWGGLSVLFVLVSYFVSPDSFEWNFKLQPFLILLLIAVLLIPIQTSFEEFFFRGYLMQVLGKWTKNVWFPLLFTSVSFGLMHLSNPEVAKLGYGLMVYYIGTGLFLGLLTILDEGLELALGFHAANNLFTALLVTSNWTAFQTHSVLIDTAEPELIKTVVPSLIAFSVLLIICAKKYQWEDWKNKLTTTWK